MTRPWLSVICPTIGEDTLVRTLASVRLQEPDPRAVEILVMGDTHAGTHAARLLSATPLCERFQARYLTHDGGTHCVGQPQRTAGQRLATGQWLVWTQADDVYTQGAFRHIREAIAALESPKPILFKARSGCAGYVVWRQPVLSLGDIDAGCPVFPNVPGRLAPWPNDYCGDYLMIRDTLELWNNAVEWREELIALGRPRLSEDWTRALR